MAFTLPSKTLESPGPFHVDFLALLPEETLHRLASAPPVRHATLPLVHSVSRCPLYCVWDEVYADFSPHASPLLLPPFWEARKMLRLEVRLEAPLETVPEPPAMIRLELPDPDGDGRLAGAVHPGYLVPLVDVKEKQVPGCKFVRRSGEVDFYRHTFYGLDPDRPSLFLVAYPEEGDPFHISPGDCDSKRYESPRKIRSYTVIAEKRGSLAPSLQARLDKGGGELPEVHRQILSILDDWREAWQPALHVSSLLTPLTSTFATRGDLRHLLKLHPLSKFLSVDLASIEPVRDEESSLRLDAYRRQNERIVDYAWSHFHRPSKTRFRSLAERNFHFVLDFEYRGALPEGIEIFIENLEDYLCSCLDQFVGGPYRFLSRAGKERAVS